MYLPKKKRHLAEQLALKKYLSLELEDAIREKAALDSYLRLHDSEYGKARQLLTEIPEYQKLLNFRFIPLNQELNDWMNSPYEKSNKYSEQLIYDTGFGYSVRSKSELLIDYALHTNKIPFRYENPIELDNIIIYPDFTIRHPTTGEFFYWEHFGMMDDPAYIKNVFAKLNLYVINGIVPNINLITTYETKDNPLDTKQVHIMLESYFQ